LPDRSVAREAHRVPSCHHPMSRRIHRLTPRDRLLARRSGRRADAAADPRRHLSARRIDARITLPLSPGVRVGNVIYVSGQVELDVPDGRRPNCVRSTQGTIGSQRPCFLSRADEKRRHATPIFALDLGYGSWSCNNAVRVLGGPEGQFVIMPQAAIAAISDLVPTVRL